MAENHLEEPAEAPAPTDPSESPGTTADDQERTALKAERDDLYDRLLRKTAEFDNYRKRIERERREQADQAVVNLLQQLLQVVDDFDLALTVEAGEEAAGYRKGVGRSRRWAPISIRTSTRPFSTNPAPRIAKAK
jgi:molecular chaperone GrpE